MKMRKLFHDIFDFKKYDRPKGINVDNEDDLMQLTKKFACYVTTNGTMASVHFMKLVGFKGTMKEPALEPYYNFRFECDIDPGFRYFIGFIMYDRITGECRNFLLKSRE